MEKSFLNWTGNKYKILTELVPLIHSFKKEKLKEQTFIEPFLGSGTIFLNLEKFDNFILNDLNVDIFMLFNQIKNDAKIFIQETKIIFNEETNQQEFFKSMVKKYNHTNNYYEKCKIFLYLNRHSFNGLMRFNKLGKYNASFGNHFSSPYYPEKEINLMHEKLTKNKVQIFNYSFETIFDNLQYGDIIYCDPPALKSLKNKYENHLEFSYEQHKLLVNLAITACLKGSIVIISNYYNEITQELYKDCSEYYIKRGNGSSHSKIKNNEEIIAIYA